MTSWCLVVRMKMPALTTDQLVGLFRAAGFEPKHGPEKAIVDLRYSVGGLAGLSPLLAPRHAADHAEAV